MQIHCRYRSSGRRYPSRFHPLRSGSLQLILQLDLVESEAAPRSEASLPTAAYAGGAPLQVNPDRSSDHFGAAPVAAKVPEIL